MFKDPQRCTFVKLPENSSTKAEDTQHKRAGGYVPGAHQNGLPKKGFPDQSNKALVGSSTLHHLPR